MTKEEIIAILENYKSFEDNRTEDLLHHGYDNTKSSRKRKEALDEAIKALSENKGEWIPVTERLPEPEDKQEVKVIVSYENEDGEFVEKGVFNKRYGFNFPSVKAWQPLPEPYKEGGKE